MDTPTEKVRLRPTDEADVTFLRQLFQEPGLIGEFGWTRWGDPHDWRRRWEENGLLRQDFGVFLVVLGDESDHPERIRGDPSGVAMSPQEMGRKRAHDRAL